ncbi:MAG: hypothetical protein M1830_009066 [Pleopsidium flavum]|nr:MAG: hypothetical protein M1830_009066 [Pleopsidium flavum]
MSQRPTASDPQPSSPLKVRPSLTSATQPVSQAQSTGAPIAVSSYAAGHGVAPAYNAPAPSLPSQQQGLGAALRSVDQRPSRSFGVHSILNPTEVDIGTNVQGQIPSAPRLGLSSPTLKTLPPHVSSSVTRPPDGDSALGQTVPFKESMPEMVARNREPRRILTPRSPTSRAGRSGQTYIPTATIDARKSPFLTPRSRVYIAEPGAPANPEIPPMPTPPAALRYSYGFPPPAPTPPLQGRVASGGAAQAPHSQSASPSTSYSSYSQLSHTSPAPQYGMPSSQTPQSHFYPSFSTGSAPSSGPQITLASESQFGPATTTMGQSYQLMTFDTDQGPIQVPVDVQAASKMADEKRKRNAGASARFRQRRKEKEKEASQTIAKLEQQIRESNEERDFYRHERDYFRGLVYSSTVQGQVAPRQPSPRERRSLPITGSSTSGGGWQGSEPRGETGRSTRRRTGAYAPPFALPPPTTSAAPLPPGYGLPPSFQPSLSDNRPNTGSGNPPPPITGLPPRTKPYDPFTPEGYDRSWNPGR